MTEGSGGVSMVTENTNGWIAVQSQITGPWPHEWVYYRAPYVQQSRALAISHGFSEFGHDDFNVGQIKNGKLIWWGWMDDPLMDDLISVADALGLAVAS